MPQVLPGRTGGSRLRVASVGVSADVMTSVAFLPAIAAAIRRDGGAPQVRTDRSSPRTSASPPATAGLPNPLGYA